MNILPKKSWHVRNKDNIARVRRDEAEAAEEECRRRKRAELAEQEARTDFLRKKASLLLSESSDRDLLQVAEVSRESAHINLFPDVEEGKGTNRGNKEYEEEKHEEKERREKALGILTYFGQSAFEAQTSRPWYQEAPTRYKKDVDDCTTHEKLKGKLDPLHDIQRYLHRRTQEKNKYSERKYNTIKTKPKERTSEQSIEQLRQDRLKREIAERARAKTLLSGRRNCSSPQQEVDDRKRQYNSQFNPQVARKSKAHEERWRCTD